MPSTPLFVYTYTMRSFIFCLQLGTVIAFFTLIGQHIVQPSFSPVPNKDLSSALLTVNQQFKSNLAELEHAITIYQTQAEAGAEQFVLQEAHLETRALFKRVEYLLEFIDPIAVKRYLNGAPLPKTEPKVPEVVIIEPSGLQVLDELVFAENIDYETVVSQVAKLAKHYHNIQSYSSTRRIEHRHVFEAMKLELVRIFTLGVTGFDTPGSLAALSESATALKSLQENYLVYSPFVAEENEALNELIIAAFNTGVTALLESDFDSFDRLAFLLDCINPLTEYLPKAQRILSIETSANKRVPSPINQAAGKLFEADWLNKNFYAQLTPTDKAEARRELGALLFFDPILSINNLRSCASCHQPERAFTDGRSKSLALDGKGTILRNSPSLINAVYTEKFFADLREERFTRQAKHVVLDSLEFGTDFLKIMEKLKQSKTYRDLFAQAYADHPAYSLSQWSITDAISHYVASRTAHNSTFDLMARGEATIDAQVRRGFNLFMGKAACGTCHFAPTFSGLVPPLYEESESEVLGVPATVAWENATIDGDLGRINNYRPQDEAYFNLFAFKTPTVRNAELTGPYMHNGVYQSLEEVMDFYNRGGGAGIGSAVDHQTLPPDPLGLANDEISDLIVFMQSLTDTVGLTSKPAQLPIFEDQPDWNKRVVGGVY